MLKAKFKTFCLFLITSLCSYANNSDGELTVDGLSFALVATWFIAFVVIVILLLSRKKYKKVGLTLAQENINLEEKIKKLKKDLKDEQEKVLEVEKMDLLEAIRKKEKFNIEIGKLLIKKDELSQEIASATYELNERKTMLDAVNDELNMESFGLYKPKYDFANSSQYKFKLEEIINILWDNLIRAKWVLAWGQEFDYVHWSLNFWEFTDKSGHFNLITSTDFDENILWLNLKEKNMETNNYNLSEMLDFSKSEEKINILLRQYNERNEMNFELENLNNSLKNAKTEQERQDISEKITKLKFTQDKLWDDMKYDNPYIWVEYKIQAYTWGAGEIKTINDFRTHCNKPDYICGKRLDFLNKYLKEKYDLDIMDDNSVDWNEYLSEFLENWIIKELSQNKEFMEKWLSYEYFMRGDEVAKWKNYVKN